MMHKVSIQAGPKRLSPAALLPIVLCFVLMLLGGCAPLPSLENRTLSSAMRDTESTRPGQRIEPLAAAHPGKSGIHPRADSLDAFAARVLMAVDPPFCARATR